MKIVQDAAIAVNARGIKSFRSLTDGTGDADDGRRELWRCAFLTLARRFRATA
jgi:hypothetical protein